jgi:hypothetical protein
MFLFNVHGELKIKFKKAARRVVISVSSADWIKVLRLTIFMVRAI